MKKSQKWIMILMIAVPVIIITVSLIVSGISLKDFPVWAIITVSTVILVSPFTFFLTQRSAQWGISDASLKRQKKRFLTVWGAYIIFLAIILVVIYYFNYQFFQPFLFIQTAFLLSLFFMNFRLFFPKKKESTEDDKFIRKF
ncbi:MAG: hypothetical protein LBV02_03020 [Bacteroidales bacterium]|jgi:hypothetical protein|nr:hypothetical protein [Bacteroidales bacterium]